MTSQNRFILRVKQYEELLLIFLKSHLCFGFYFYQVCKCMQFSHIIVSETSLDSSPVVSKELSSFTICLIFYVFVTNSASNLLYIKAVDTSGILLILCFWKSLSQDLWPALAWLGFPSLSGIQLHPGSAFIVILRSPLPFVPMLGLLCYMFSSLLVYSYFEEINPLGSPEKK